MRKQTFNFKVSKIEFKNNSNPTIVTVEDISGIRNKGGVSRLIEKSPQMLDLLWAIKIYGSEACKKELDAFFNNYYEEIK